MKNLIISQHLGLAFKTPVLLIIDTGRRVLYKFRPQIINKRDPQMRSCKPALLATILFSAVQSLTAYAAPVPTQCPGVEAIKAAGLASAERVDEDGGFAVGQVNTYGTPNNWGFVIFVPYTDAGSEQDALNKANQSLPTLTGGQGPIQNEGRWICTYSTANGYQAGALTPIPMNNIVRAIQFRK
jgi:hypothetical protein